MICDNCGKQVRDEADFCPFCGNALKKKGETVNLDKIEKKHGKSGKGILLGIIGICVCVMAILTIKNVYTAYSNKPENKFKRTANEFVEYLSTGDYEKAEKIIYFPYAVGGSFQKFAEENLKDCKLEKTKEGYTLISDKDSYKLSYDESENRLTSEDFIMEYHVKYSSYVSSSQNTFTGNGVEVLEDGMSLYTKKVYKTHEIEFNCDVILGEQEGLAPQVTVRVKTDDDYKACELIEAFDYLDSSESYDGVYLEEDGTIVVDMYYISEDYSEKIATIFSGYITDMSYAALSGESFDTFISGYNSYIFETDALRKEYEAWYDNRSTLMQYFDKTDNTSVNWNYPQEFRYSDGEYVIQDTVTSEAFKNDVLKSTTTDLYYVLFKPGKEGFKVYSYADTRENLYTTQNTENQDENKQSAEEMLDSTAPAWKKAYTSFLQEHTSEIAACELAYLNDDDIPELFTCSEESPSHATGVKIYSISGEEVKQIGTQEYGSYGSITIYEKTGVMVSSNSGMGCYYTDFYKFNGDSNLEELCHLYAADVDVPDSSKYYIDDVEVQAEEFEAKEKELEPKDAEGKDVPVNGMTVNEMINAIIHDSEKGNASDYILPTSDSAYLTEKDLSALTKEQLRLARNEIYARHGYIFNDEELKEYFQSKSWYTPSTEEVTDDMLNVYEIANRDLIINVE